MGQTIKLNSRHDGFAFDAWHEPAREARRGGLVIIHAIWGVTPHLIELAADFAAGGYEVLIPSLFDREEPGFPSHNVDPALREHRIALAQRADDAIVVEDLQTAVEALEGPVFAMGFCWGGRAAWLAAGRVDGLTAVSAFYPSYVADIVELSPQVPTQTHFGVHDNLLPMELVERLAALHPDVQVWTYDAGHAFVAPGPDHNEDAAKLAMLRTRQAFHRAQGKSEMGG